MLAKSKNARLVIITKSVLVGLSGGVDSSVAVHILKEQGYKVAGCVLEMSDCHKKAVEDARTVAAALDIELYEVDMHSVFKTEIIDYFANTYKSGKTPSPCIICNPKVKFKALLDTADKYGFDYIATGHYAKIEEENGIFKLRRGEIAERDQSYMLYRLEQNVLSRLLLPLYSIEKPKVREIARSLNLSCADAPDSQEICFVSDNDYAGYIEREFGGMKKGEFISPDGKVCGEHKGIIHYTVGQRKGLGIALGRPAFISKIDALENKIYLAFDMPTVSEVILNSKAETYKGALDIPPDKTVFVKLRSRMPAFEATIRATPDSDIITVIPKAPVKKVPAGQGGVVYDGDTVLGGGIIDS